MSSEGLAYRKQAVEQKTANFFGRYAVTFLDASHPEKQLENEAQAVGVPSLSWAGHGFQEVCICFRTADFVQ